MSKITPFLPAPFVSVLLLFPILVYGNGQMDICGFERPTVAEKIWPVFLHDPGKPGEMEQPNVDVLINREGQPISILPVNEIPEDEMKTLRMIIPAMKYTAGNACEEPIEGYAKCVFNDYFVLQEPSPETENLRAPQPRWRVSIDLSSRLTFYSLSYKNSVAVVDFHLDAEGNVTKLKGHSKYGKVLASKLFKADMNSMKFMPAKVDGHPVSSVIRLFIGSGKEVGKETTLLGSTAQPYHTIRSWPENLPLNELFTVDAELIISDDGIVTDVVFLSQMPPELSTQLVTDLRAWKLDPAKLPESEGPKSLRIKVGYSPEDASPALLEISARLIKWIDPEPIYQKPPTYPMELRRSGVSGLAIIQFMIDKEGQVRDMSVEHADNDEFARASMEAIRSWKFKPAEYNGSPVSIWVRQPVPFSFSR